MEWKQVWTKSNATHPTFPPSRHKIFTQALSKPISQSSHLNLQTMKTSVFQLVASVLIFGNKAQLSSGANASNLRGLQSDPFKKFGGKACRTSSGGKGSNGHEFNAFYISRNECRKKCLYSSSKCYGWEYSSGGKCEVWKSPIDQYELDYKHGIDCYIDKYELDEGDEEGGHGEVHFEKFEDRGCRTNYGRKGSAGNEYYLYRHVSKNTCKNKCIHLGSECYGWEYSSGGKCEVWKVPINKYKLAHVHDLDCYIKYW